MNGEEPQGPLDMFKSAIMALVILVLTLAALGLALDAFQEDFDSGTACTNSSYYFNKTSRVCCENSTDAGCEVTHGGSTALNATSEGLEGTTNASSYLSTIGTLLGVAALIAVVVAAFYIIRR